MFPILSKSQKFVLIIWLISCAILVYILYKRAERNPAIEDDVYYVYVEGQNILQHINPYSRIHSSNMLHNDKYPTYLPGAYLLSALSQYAGLVKYPKWIRFWRRIFFLCYIGTGALLFLQVLQSSRALLAAMIAASLWLFNRWSLLVLQIAHIDMIAILLFLLGLHLRQKRPRLSWLCYGASLAIKQMMLFAIPLLLIELWQETATDTRRRRIVHAILSIGSIPVLVSLPFLIADPVAFIKSMLFTVTREPGLHVADSPDLFSALLVYGPLARVPMFAFLAGIYALAWKRVLPLYPAILAQMAILLWFNPVLFQQYLIWDVPFLLLVIFGSWQSTRNLPAAESSP